MPQFEWVAADRKGEVEPEKEKSSTETGGDGPEKSSEGASDEQKVAEAAPDQAEKRQNILKAIESGKMEGVTDADVDDLVASGLVTELPRIEQAALALEASELKKKSDELYHRKGINGVGLFSYKRLKEINETLPTLGWLDIREKRELRRELFNLENKYGIRIHDDPESVLKSLEAELAEIDSGLETIRPRRNEIGEILGKFSEVGERWISLPEDVREAGRRQRQRKGAEEELKREERKEEEHKKEEDDDSPNYIPDVTSGRFGGGGGFGGGGASGDF